MLPWNVRHWYYLHSNEQDTTSLFDICIVSIQIKGNELDEILKILNICDYMVKQRFINQ